jgi:transposase
MVRQIRPDYDQIFLFPPSLEDWVKPDDPVRFIRDFVDSLDLAELGFVMPECKTGRPPYAPDLLLKVWMYGYYNRIMSTRLLEKACYQHMGLIWLTGNNPPDHNSLWRFFNKNRHALQELFKKSVQVAVKADLIGLVLHALDGTKIPAKSSTDKARNHKQLEKLLEQVSERLDVTIADMMTEVERLEQEESGEYRLPRSMQDGFKRKQRINEALSELDTTDKKAVHPSEPEARFMKNRRSKELSYNAQAVADRESGMIVAADVVTEGADNGELVPMLDRVKETVGSVAEENVADGGYFASSQIGLAEERGYEVLVAKSSGEVKSEKDADTNPYHRSRFVYDEEHDCCICPEGAILPFHQRKVNGKNHNEVRRYRCRVFQACANRWQCSESKNGRLIDVSVHYKELERHWEKREKPESKELLKARKVIVEPVFGWIKGCMGFRRWTVSGLINVRAQWSLVCTAVNLKKLYPYWVSGKLILSPG